VVSPPSLHPLLGRRGSYPALAAAVVAGRLPRFPGTLFDHVRDVYGQVEASAGAGCPWIEVLRLAALVPTSRRRVTVSSASSSCVISPPPVRAVTAAFGAVRVRTAGELHAYVAACGAHLEPALLFELDPYFAGVLGRRAG